MNPIQPPVGSVDATAVATAEQSTQADGISVAVASSKSAKPSTQSAASAAKPSPHADDPSVAVAAASAAKTPPSLSTADQSTVADITSVAVASIPLFNVAGFNPQKLNRRVKPRKLTDEQRYLLGQVVQAKISQPTDHNDDFADQSSLPITEYKGPVPSGSLKDDSTYRNSTSESTPTETVEESPAPVIEPNSTSEFTHTETEENPAPAIDLPKPKKLTAAQRLHIEKVQKTLVHNVERPWSDGEFQALSSQNSTRVIAQMHNCMSVIGNPEGDGDSRNPVISSGERQILFACTVHKSF